MIFDSVTIYGEENANRRIIMKSVMRYAVVVILFFILGYFKFGSLYTALIGILGLKVSAYVQPLFQKDCWQIIRAQVMQPLMEKANSR